MSAQNLKVKTRDELYEVAKSQSVEGRSKMTKGELLEALTDEQRLVGPKDVDFDELKSCVERRGEFSDMLEVEEGDVVEVSHLSQATPVVTGVERNDDTIIVTMKTTQGGRHRLIVPLDGGPRARGAHLRRYRGPKDDRWMMNSSTPYFLRIVAPSGDRE
ncbi:hypothetical protein C497_05627 [Halalkalicoccus jeotgali B3]|uniref:Rho termination factor-like N-terminal domain-containing protein n=3 Tax=Halalkalicoccus jeotgali TaxID=413810 RepID=L9VQR6_HALJB|nr:hypothetical protein C497_05627 [Halalkalicoccus jeotgali B3]